MKPKIAIVTGLSEKCYPMYKQMVASWCKNILNQDKYKINLYPYMCNFIIKDINLYFGTIDKSIKIQPEWYKYKNFENTPDFMKDLFFWKGRIFPQNNVDLLYTKSELPDMTIYQNFSDKFLYQYDYVIFTHSDIKFKENNSILNDIMNILNDETDYSIIANPTVNADVHISFRFITFLNIVNSKKFIKQKLSYINDEILMDPVKYHVHSNGGNALFASFYSKKNNPINKYKPHSLKAWIDHLVHTEFRFVIEDAAKNLIPGCDKFENCDINIFTEDAKVAYKRVEQAEQYYKNFCKEYENANL